MSLLDEAMEKFVMLDKRTKPDGYGGTTSEWTEGAEFLAVVRFDSSLQARIAEKQGVTGLYTVITPKAVILDFHDVFKRLSDSKVFRVTSKNDKVTPDSASKKLRECTAEEWVLN